MRIVHLFPNELASSGDSGNVQTLSFRLEKRGHSPEVLTWSGEGAFPRDVDAVVIGNGPWSAAKKLLGYVTGISAELCALRDSGVVFFAVGTGAELLARTITDGASNIYPGAEVFPFSAIRDADRRVGYMRISHSNGDLIGFGDFASVWDLDDAAYSLGNAVVGDRPSAVASEGCCVENSIATRLGGPALPLNPALADSLIAKMLARRGSTMEASALSVDEYATNARSLILKNLDSVFTTIAL
jgi:CobQ-like glutamine amidotransferase family enzyme